MSEDKTIAKVQEAEKAAEDNVKNIVEPPLPSPAFDEKAARELILKAIRDRELQCLAQVQQVLHAHQCSIEPMIQILGNRIESQWIIRAVDGK